MFYWVKTPSIIKKCFPSLIWEQKVTDAQKTIYLTFDDGPTPMATKWVLDQLKQYNAPATFFCLGKNVVEYPALYQEIIAQKHSIGNHTFHHLNGWKTSATTYLSDVTACAKLLPTPLFRPPYGRISYKQMRLLHQARFNIIMWSVLSGDFDQGLTPEQCLQQTLAALYPGAILVFHDSPQAFENIKYVLPNVLAYCQKEGYQFKRIIGEQINN